MNRTITLASNSALAVLALGCAAAEPRDPYPLTPETILLEKDGASESYRLHLEKFHINDLHAEWQRAFGADGAEAFASSHGGIEAVRADPLRLAALERRRRIDGVFLEKVRAEYARRGVKAPFDEGEKVEAGAVREAARADDSLSIEPILPGEGAEREWPRWRGPGGQGLSLEKDVPVEWDGAAAVERNIAWSTEVPGKGNSSPVIWGERIFLTTAFDGGKRRSLAAFRRADGALLYVKDAPPVPPEGRVMAKNGYASATPAVDGERVVAFFGNGGLVAFDLEGNVLWHYPFPPFDAMHGTGASPVICGDLAILFQEQSSKPSLGVAVDKRTGEERWKIERPAALGWSTPVPVKVAGRPQLLYGAHESLVSYDPATGKDLWRCGGPTIEVVPTVVCAHGLVYSSSGRNGPTIAVRPDGAGDVSGTKLAWRVVRGAPHVPSPVVTGDRFYQVNDTGVLTCLDARTGATVYQSRLEGRFSSSPVAAGGNVYFTNEEGETFVVRDGPGFEIVAKNPLGEPVLASAAILGGRIYLRGQSRLYAVGTK